MSPASKEHPRLPFTSPFLLAPMEGVTDRLFRSLVLARNQPDALGGATTEFMRVTDRPLNARRLGRELTGECHGRPIGLQLLGANVLAVAGSAAAAVEAGAAFVDLNFGCPAKGALRGSAGSALLDKPAELGALVAAAAHALESSGVPLTAKLRAGGEDDRCLEDLVKSAVDGGASMLTVHCRTRREGYRNTADWRRLERAVAVSSVPICGNGGIETHADLERMLNETGCAFAMVGRAALADPWIFSGIEVPPTDALTFFREYSSGLPPSKRSSSRLKQLITYWQAGNFLGSQRQEILRLTTDQDVLAMIERLARRTSI